jgi:hypothetical protein
MRSVEAFEENPVNEFIATACVDIHGWHGGGTLKDAETILAESAR